MVEKIDLYAILRLPKGASIEAVKKSYRELAKKYHPDRAKSPEQRKEFEERFKQINQAYSILSDPKKKKQFDTFGFAGRAGGFDPFAGFRTYSWGPFSYAFSEEPQFIDLDLEDLFGFNPFEVFFNRGYARQGAKLLVEKEIPFTTAVLGGEVEIETPEGKFILRVPQGTSSGSEFQVREGGKLFYIRVTISVPSNLNKEQRDLLAQLAKKGI